MAFEDIIKTCEEADRSQLAALAQKYPGFREYAELGERVSVYRPRLKDLNVSDQPEHDYSSNVGLAVEELEKWREFKKEWPSYESRSRSTEEALESAMAKVAELEAKTDADMTPDEIRTIIREEMKTASFATPADIDARLEKFGNERVVPSMNGLGNRMRGIYAKITPKVHQHARDFDGEILDPDEVFAYMDKHKIDDANKAYSEMMAPRFAEKQAKQAEADKAKAREDGIAEGRKQAAAASGRSQPVGGNEGSGNPGALITRFREKQAARAAEGKQVEGKLGKGVIAAQHSHEYMEKQMAGTGAQ